MQVFANYQLFSSVTSRMHWNLPEACSCGKRARLVLLLSWVWNPHIRPAASPSSCLLSGYSALLTTAALLVYGANPLSAQAGTVSAPSPGSVGWAQGAPRSLELWRTIFQGLLELLRFGWDEGGEVTKLMFSAANLLTCVEKYRGRDGQQCRDAHIITQTSPFWLLLSPRQRHKHRKAEKQLINFLSWPRSQSDRFWRESQPSGRDRG